MKRTGVAREDSQGTYFELSCYVKIKMYEHF